MRTDVDVVFLWRAILGAVAVILSDFALAVPAR
jgi:hypothetical protein